MDQLTHAKFYATQKHAGQYYGVLNYTHHLQDVERVLRRFGAKDEVDEDLLVGSWLHDAVEDTNTKLRDVEELFGSEVAHLVGAVTAEPGLDRKTRVALTYPKTRKAGPRAVRLKLADRIANVENGGASVKNYRNEYPDFRHALYTPGDNEDMWQHLDTLLSYKK